MDAQHAVFRTLGIGCFIAGIGLGIARVSLGGSELPSDRMRPSNAISRAGEYAKFVRLYSTSSDPALVTELAGWSNDETRVAVQQFAGLIEEARRLWLELAALKPPEPTDSALRKYRAERADLITKLSRVYDAIYSGDTAGLSKPISEASSPTSRAQADVNAALSSPSWRDGLPEPLTRYVRSAVALHTSVAALSWRNGGDRQLAMQLEFAAAYLPNLVVEDDSIYGKLWCKTAVALLTSPDHQAQALKTVDQCLTWFPSDASLLLARGSLFESVSMLMGNMPLDRTLGDWPRQLRDSAVQQKKAATDYETALHADPNNPEAQIRLARLRLRAGDLAGSQRALATLEIYDLPPVLAYWGWMIDGGVAERAGQPDDAAARYGAALTLFPRAQSAAIALAHVMASDLGKREEAVTILRDRLSQSTNRQASDDPWWIYGMGQTWRLPAWLEAINAENRMP